ncbi:MAG: hypothetical protein Ct9H90mP3_0540 [Flammeovirgaceae bacterium]|nr:MAG: hypothetical protein Ct9H90mP3_0540 [Flammeovirgaceae bacterium]
MLFPWTIKLSFKSNLKGFALSLSGGLILYQISILTYEMFKRILEKQGIETLNKKFNLNLIPSENSL